MKIGANSVLFGGHDIEAAFKYIALAGYDGIELSAINGMSEHLVLENWRELAPKIKWLARQYNLELLAMEQPSLDSSRNGTSLPGCRRNRHSHCQLRAWREIERRKSLVKGSQHAGQTWHRWRSGTVLICA